MQQSGGIVPHPPLLIPEIGRGDLSAVSSTIAALETLAGRLRYDDPALLVISSPHHPEARPGAVGIGTTPRFRGDFARFGAPHVGAEFDGVPDIASALLNENLGAATFPLASEELDWGFMVFLELARRLGFHPRVLPLAISRGGMRELYGFGFALSVFIERTCPDTRCSFVASGDLSHVTRAGAGREYDAFGPVFDNKFVRALESESPGALFAFTDAELVRARQCGAAGMAAAAGFYARGKIRASRLSYEDPFGVGYLVAMFEVPDGSA